MESELLPCAFCNIKDEEYKSMKQSFENSLRIAIELKNKYYKDVQVLAEVTAWLKSKAISHRDNGAACSDRVDKNWSYGAERLCLTTLDKIKELHGE